MKKFVTSLFLLTLCLCAGAQTTSGLTSGQFNAYATMQAPEVPFRLIPTTDLQNFIKLDTRTGQLWVIQRSTISESKTLSWTLDDSKLAEATDGNIGRFILCPTGSNYNFILLDQTDGRTWEVQFSLTSEESNRRTEIGAPVSSSEVKALSSDEMIKNIKKCVVTKVLSDGSAIATGTAPNGELTVRLTREDGTRFKKGDTIVATRGQSFLFTGYYNYDSPDGPITIPVLILR